VGRGGWGVGERAQLVMVVVMEVGISGYGPWSTRTLRIERPFPTSN